MARKWLWKILFGRHRLKLSQSGIVGATKIANTSAVRRIGAKAMQREEDR